MTRCGEGAAIIIWKNVQNQLELLDEIEMDQFEANVLDFKMKGNIVADFKGVNYNLVLLVFSSDKGVIVQALM